MIIKVTKTLIRRGKACDCYFCPVAEALQRATKDTEASVVGRGYDLYLHAWSRYLLAPAEVVQFVSEYDSLPPRDPGDCDRQSGYDPVIPRTLPEELQPFTFEIPDLSDPEWMEECHKCEFLFDAKELDGEGYCPQCK